MISKFYQVALSKIRDSKASYARHIVQGSPLTWESYKGICGKIHGLEEAEAILKEQFDLLFQGKTVVSSERLEESLERQLY